VVGLVGGSLRVPVRTPAALEGVMSGDMLRWGDLNSEGVLVVVGRVLGLRVAGGL
jgi:hypothetical protein